MRSGNVHNRLRRWLAATVAIVLATLGIHATRAETPPPFLKGVTVSCQTWGVEWQTPEMAADAR